MLGYISSTRKKSCFACVKSKRRCDLGYPCCKRCFTKGLDCTYPNASVRDAEVVIRQATPDLVPVTTNASDAIVRAAEIQVPFSQSTSDIDPVLLAQSSDSSSPESTQDELCGRQAHPEPRLWEELLPQVWEPIILTEAQVLYSVKQLRAFVPSIAYTGDTLFMHEELYQHHQPTAYQDSCSLAALYLARTSKNITILTNSIDSKISALISSSNGWSLREHLAAVQALIIYQIIRLFDPDLNQQASAVKQNGLLELWTAHLWKRCFNEPNTFTDCYESWVFYESLRRSVLMSVFLRGIWSCVTKGGLCDQTPILARLPLTKDSSLWKSNIVEWNGRNPCANERESLIAYGDLSKTWKLTDSPEKLNDFERLLLAACRGKEDARLLI